MTSRFKSHWESTSSTHGHARTMKSSLKRLKSLIVGSPVEPLARKLYGALGARMGKGHPDHLIALSAINKAYDDQTLAVMSRVLTSTSNCIDVGAHRGSILKEILAVAPLGQHFAFEPLPDCYEYLESSFPTVSVHRMALADSAGESTFQQVTSSPEYSGLRRRRYDRPQEFVVEIKVQSELLDNVIPQLVKIDFIKIDVEGAELQVLQGAVKTIRRCRPTIVFEHGLGAADYYGTTPEMIYDFFSGCGYLISLMESWLKEGAPLSKRELCDRFYNGLDFYFLAYSATIPPAF